MAYDDSPKCGNCHWYMKQPPGMILNSTEQGLCYAMPPQCTTIPTKQGGASLTSRPTVKPSDRACQAFHPRSMVGDADP